MWNTEGIFTTNDMQPMCYAIITSQVDKSIYSVERYENMTILYVQNKLYNTSAVAFSVNIGYSSDPENIPGLNRFAQQHGLFAGREGSLDTFVSRYGGRSKGKTDANYTTYYFDVNSRYLKEAVQKFTSFFINPMANMDNDTVSTVIKELEGEVSTKMHGGWFRTCSVLIDMMREEATLKNMLGCRNRDGYRKVGNEGLARAAVDLVYNKYRNAEMTLVICSNQTLNYMRDTAKEFQILCNTNKIVDDNRMDVDEIGLSDAMNVADELFPDEGLSRIIYYKPLTNQKQIKIVTILPLIGKHININPLGYIKNMFKNQNFDRVIASMTTFNYEEHGNYIIVKMETPSSADGNIKDFVSRIHRCINYLRANEKAYKYIKSKMDVSFSFKEQKTSFDKAFEMATNSMEYPLEYVSSAKDILGDYDADIIDRYISTLGDFRKWIVLVEDPTIEPASYNDKTVFTEKQSGIQYSFGEKLSEWINFEIKEVLTDKDVGDFKEIKIPALIKDKRGLKRKQVEGGELNFIFDNNMGIPRVYVAIMLASDDARWSQAIYYMYFRMFLYRFKEKHRRKLEDENTNLSVHLSQDGITVVMEGFPDCVKEISELFFSNIKNDNFLNEFSNRNLEPVATKSQLDWWFNSVRGAVLANYNTVVNRMPFNRTVEKLRMALTMSSLFAEDDLKIIRYLTVEDVKIKRKFFVQMIAVGNAQFSVIVEMFNKVWSLLGAKDVYTGIKVNNTPLLISFETVHKERNVVGLFYAVNKYRNDPEFDGHAEYSGMHRNKSGLNLVEDQREKRSAIAELVLSLISKDFFNNCKGNADTGYLASAESVYLKSAEYISFSIQSSENSELIKNKILRFVCGIRSFIQSISDAEFEIRKRVLADTYLVPWMSLRSLFVWTLASRAKGYIDLNIRSRMATLIMNLTKKDLIDADIWTSYIEVRSVSLVESRVGN